jgi:hypothetical protein
MSYFYRIKEICINLGISYQTLYNNANSGKWPPLEHPNPVNTRVSGYSDATYRKIVSGLTKASE